MSKLSELPYKAQVGIVVVLAVAITAALYFFFYKTVDDQNRASLLRLSQKNAENAQLKPYADKLVEMDRQIASLKQQLEIQKRIVPDEKEAPRFMHLMQDTAAQAGIEIRRYTAKPTTSKEFFTEVPFEMELDGPYYALLKFFEKSKGLERIINVSGLQMANLARGSEVKAKRKYQYAPTESVVAVCTATTFFSHDASSQPASAAAPAAPAAPAPVKK
jgi:type IV pilus assembly protein PilO